MSTDQVRPPFSKSFNYGVRLFLSPSVVVRTAKASLKKKTYWTTGLSQRGSYGTVDGICHNYDRHRRIHSRNSTISDVPFHILKNFDRGTRQRKSRYLLQWVYFFNKTLPTESRVVVKRTCFPGLVIPIVARDSASWCHF